MTNTTNTAAASGAEDLQDVVSKALRRAWQLGQTYWRQADSDSLADHRRSELTQESFGSLVDETRAALAAPAQDARKPLTDAQIDAATLEVIGIFALDIETNQTARMIARTIEAAHGIK